MSYNPNNSGLLNPAQRKSFTFKTDVAMQLAYMLSKGDKLSFQSVANRNWVAKLARTKFGANVEVYVNKEILYNPALTVEGKLSGMAYTPDNNHYLTTYVAKYVSANVPTPPTVPTRNYNPAPVRNTGWLSESYVSSEGNIW